MKSDKNKTQYHLRPHHLFCERYGTFEMPGRGEDFYSFQKSIEKILNDETDTVIEVTAGPDDICIRCPDCINNRCESPDGNEEKVAKWDAIVMSGLRINFGEKWTAKDLRKLISEKAPLKFCRERCRARERCKIFDK